VQGISPPAFSDPEASFGDCGGGTVSKCGEFLIFEIP